MSMKRNLPVETSNAPIRKSARLAAKSIKATQEQDQIVYEKLTLTLADNGHAVYIEALKDPETTREVEYEATPEGYIVRNLQDHSEKKVEGSSFIEAAVQGFVKILKTPKLHLKQLVIDFESPESVCRKIEAAHKMYHPEDEDFECTPPECIKTLYDENRSAILELLEQELELLTFKLSVECVKMELRGIPSQLQRIISALQPITLEEIVIGSGCPYNGTPEFVYLEQWKKAERLECFCMTDMDVEHWKHFKVIDIELNTMTEEELDETLETFLFFSTWERVSMQFRSCDVPRNDYFEEFNIPETTVIPGIVDNWVIEVPKMNHRVFVIFSEGTLHLFRKHWVVDRKKLVPIRRKYRKAEAVLAELPDVITRNIAGQLDEMSRRSLGQTCRSFKHIVSTTGATYEKLTLTLADNRPAIFIELFLDPENRLELEFEQHPLGYTVRNPQEEWEQTVVYKQYRHGLKPKYDFIGGAVDHLLKIFTKKTVVKKFCIVTEDPHQVLTFLRSVVPSESASEWYNTRLELTDSYNNSYTRNLEKLEETLLDLLSRKQHSLKVQHFEVCHGESCDNSLRILKYLDPNVLQRISISGMFLEEDVQEIASFVAWKRAQELLCSANIPADYWSHFPRSVISCNWISQRRIEEILNALFVSTTWNNVLITSGFIAESVKRFLNGLEDQRPVASRNENLKLIRIPSIPNQFINYQLINGKNISFTRVIQ